MHIASACALIATIANSLLCILYTKRLADVKVAETKKHTSRKLRQRVPEGMKGCSCTAPHAAISQGPNYPDP